MRNLKITLAYDGAEFSGWQVQPGRRTIQGTLGEALARITGEPASMLPQGSGRTDAGVHALAQVASYAIRSTIPLPNLVVALNDLLPASIRVLEISEVPSGFHARASAHAKTYRYRIYRASICPPFLARYVYHHPWRLDESAMGAAALMVTGEHNFTSFAAVDPERGLRLAARQSSQDTSENHRSPGSGGPDNTSESDCAATNVRTIYHSEFAHKDQELIYTVRGSGFLHHMVRNLVGTFLLAGKGTLKPQDIARILAARDRRANPGATVPARGLYLVSVEYEQGSAITPDSESSCP